MEPVVIFDWLQCFDDAEPRGPAMNMAIDEALFAAVDDGSEARPLLRTYRWNGPAVSLGYFDPVREARASFPDVPLVRRWTGGGMVEHGQDLTYSLIVPRELIPTPWQGTGAYRAIHAAVAEALRGCGLEGAALASGPATPGQGALRECFRRPVDYDVLLDGRKVAGGAQRRTRRGLLHQGSIQGHSTSFAPGGTLHQAIRARLPLVFASRWESRSLRETELAAATKLSITRYGTGEWMERFWLPFMPFFCSIQVMACSKTSFGAHM